MTSEQQQARTLKACQEGKAGISRTTGFIVVMEDEPDAIPIPFSSVFQPLSEISQRPVSHTQRIARRTGGSNYTPPKKKRKK